MMIVHIDPSIVHGEAGWGANHAGGQLGLGAVFRLALAALLRIDSPEQV
jgi:hypothetical protein